MATTVVIIDNKDKILRRLKQAESELNIQPPFPQGPNPQDLKHEKEKNNSGIGMPGVQRN